MFILFARLTTGHHKSQETQCCQRDIIMVMICTFLSVFANSLFSKTAYVSIITSFWGFIRFDHGWLLILFVCLVGFFGISTFVGYLMPNPFLCKLSVLFKTIQFSMSTQFNCQKYFYFKLFSLFKQLYITIQLSVSTVSMSKTVQFQTIQFSISMKFKSKYSLIVKNISIFS